MRKNILLLILMSFLILCYPVLAGEKEQPAEQKVDSIKYLNAVRQFADNVLKYGRDTYGRKHTPLFVDGLMVRHPNDPNYGKDGVFKPVEWIAPNGDRWILSNLASQQNLFRTLDGLTKITGDPKYKRAAMDAIRYAFDNLRSPNGLLWWGECIAYDAHFDKMCGDYQIHVLKAFFPYYELMWEVNSGATREFIDSFWASHILDWSNLDMNRAGPLDSYNVPKGWGHEYKGGPVFFKSKGGLSFITTGSDLYYAAAILSKLSSQKEPLIWSKRLARRYVETRDPRTGISGGVYTLPKNASEHPLARDFKGHIVHDGTILCDRGWGDPLLRRYFLHVFTFSPGVVGNMTSTPSICQLMVGEMLEDGGKEFKQWALEELSARGRVAYRRKDNLWIPMLADGTSLEGYICKRDIPGFALKGNIIKAWQADATDFWAYALAFRVTADRFMWEMARNISFGNGFGDIGSEPQGEPQLNIGTNCLNAHALLGFLSLYEKTQKGQFLDMAKRIGDNIQVSRFHKGFFVPSKKHTYAKFDAIESLTLLYLHAAIDSNCHKPALVWPSTSYFWSAYRNKGEVYDSTFIYTLTELTEPPISLNEAAITGNTNLARSLIDEGADINNKESGQFRTPLHCAATSGHTDIVELLLTEGADVNARSGWRSDTPLHCAATSKDAGKDIAELLIAHGADVDAENASGDTPMQYAAFYDRHDIIKLLLEKGATISNIHLAAYMGYLAKLDAFIQEGVGINTLDGHGYAPLHYAAQNGQKETAELLIAKGADVDVKAWSGLTPLRLAVMGGHKDIVELLITHGADINVKDNQGMTVLHYAVRDRHKDIVELLIAKRADINAKDNYGQRPLDFAMILNRKGIFELLLEGGAELSMHTAAYLGDIDKVRSFIEAGASVNGELLPHRITPLYWAVRKNHRDVAELLIKKGAKVQVKDWRGWTPLHYAAGGDKRGMAQLLIAKGADVNAKDNSGETALSVAKGKGHTEIVELLRKHGAKE